MESLRQVLTDLVDFREYQNSTMKNTFGENTNPGQFRARFEEEPHQSCSKRSHQQNRPSIFMDFTSKNYFYGILSQMWGTQHSRNRSKSTKKKTKFNLSLNWCLNSKSIIKETLLTTIKTSTTKGTINIVSSFPLRNLRKGSVTNKLDRRHKLT